VKAKVTSAPGTSFHYSRPRCGAPLLTPKFLPAVVQRHPPTTLIGRTWFPLGCVARQSNAVWQLGRVAHILLVITTERRLSTIILTSLIASPQCRPDEFAPHLTVADPTTLSSQLSRLPHHPDAFIAFSRRVRRYLRRTGQPSAGTPPEVRRAERRRGAVDGEHHLKNQGLCVDRGRIPLDLPDERDDARANRCQRCFLRVALAQTAEADALAAGSNLTASTPALSSNTGR